ncbi:MAG TPA: Crp/Fnr family transcriptional regulator [Anaerolineae bacterium]|nr:Crp/Fnr family transcriptional regulator [Anaerolineae bacterium]
MPNARESDIHPVFNQAEVFRGLAAAQLAEIAARFSARTFERGALLFLEGDPAQTYYLIAAGQLKILQTSAEGNEVILHLLGPGELVGALPTLGEGAYPASASALSDVTVFAISAADFEGILSRYPAVARNLLRFAARQLQATHHRLRELATERVERRIARTLSRLAAQIGRRESEGIVLDTPLSRQSLAELTGTTLFTASRVLKEWERRGILRVGREQVTILQPHALTVIAEDLPLLDSST